MSSSRTTLPLRLNRSCPMSEPVDAYDEMGASFDEHVRSSPWNVLYDQPVVKELVGDVEGLRLLDIGCGPGAYFEHWLAAGAKVIGTDASTAMVELARERFGDRVEVWHHDGSDPMPFLASESIDVVVSALMIHYLEDPEPMLRDIHRVLTPRGRLIVSTTHPTTDWARKGGSYFESRWESDVWSVGVEVPYWRTPLDQIVADFTDAGFVIERLVEHRASDEFKAVDPEQHAELSERPGFIAFRLIKHPNP